MRESLKQKQTEMWEIERKLRWREKRDDRTRRTGKRENLVNGVELKFRK